jgi:hypothetical protein
MEWIAQIIRRVRGRNGKPAKPAEDGRHVATELMRHRRELARSQGQAGHNLTVQTTIDMARTQTWTGGG